MPTWLTAACPVSVSSVWLALGPMAAAATGEWRQTPMGPLTLLASSSLGLPSWLPGLTLLMCIVGVVGPRRESSLRMSAEGLGQGS